MEYIDINDTSNKRNGCLTDTLKVGCGFILGIICTVLFLMFYANVMAPKEVDEEDEEDTPMTYSSPDGDTQYYKVTSQKGKATIHTGMSKDSVMLLLGDPTGFMSFEDFDMITYEYGDAGRHVLQIKFNKGKVGSVMQY